MRFFHDMIEALTARGNGKTMSVTSAYRAEKMRADDLAMGASKTDLAAVSPKMSFFPSFLETCVFGSNITLSAVVGGNTELLLCVERLVAMNEASANGVIVKCGMQRVWGKTDCPNLRNKGELNLFVLTSLLYPSCNTTNEGTVEPSAIFDLVNPMASSDRSLPSVEGDAPRSRGAAFGHKRESVDYVSFGSTRVFICLSFRVIFKALT